jgi:hypothetical protein
MRQERRTSRVISKNTYKGLQPLNGKLMFMDFPVRRPIYYTLYLENGDSLDVSASQYNKYHVGELMSYDHDIWETPDYVVLGLALLAVVVVIGLLIIAA